MLNGMACGIILGKFHLFAGNQTEAYPDLIKLAAESRGNITYYLMNKDDIMLELNQAGADLFNSLSPEGQELALKIASRSCNGENDCRGQNACQTTKNSCMGKGKCKGTTVCAISDKNLAIKLANDLMTEKRKALLETNPPTPQKL